MNEMICNHATPECIGKCFHATEHPLCDSLHKALMLGALCGCYKDFCGRKQCVVECAETKTFDLPLDLQAALDFVGLKPMVIDENTRFPDDEESVPEDISSTPNVSPKPLNGVTYEI